MHRPNILFILSDQHSKSQRCAIYSIGHPLP